MEDIKLEHISKNISPDFIQTLQGSGLNEVLINQLAKEVYAMININFPNKIEINCAGEIIGEITSCTIDLSKTPFWLPIPKVKLNVKLTNSSLANIIRDKLKKFNFILVSDA